MIETVEAGQHPWIGPVGRSPEGAIASSKSFDRKHRKRELESCVGLTIKAVQWSDQALRLYIENCKIIGIQHIEGIVNCSLTDGPFESSGMADTVLLRLAGREFLWKRAELIGSLRGRQFQRVFVTPNLLFLYVSKVGILSISTLVNLRTGRDFLFWWPSE
jgi:hypothetical protein